MLNKVKLAARSLGLSMVGLLLWGQIEKTALAQSAIRADTTLGAESSLIEVQSNNGFDATLIEGGATRGMNLFHSFEAFDIPENGGAYFIVEDPTISNIFSRVTGNNPSEILGVLGSRTGRDGLFLSPADLYLINPNGVIFGPNAQLSLGGSFAVTTADAIRFGDDGSFGTEATDPTTDLLTISPTAFLFNSAERPAPITSQSAASVSNPQAIDGLRVFDGKSLLFLGGDILIQRGVLNAANGRIALGAVSNRGTVDLTTEADRKLTLTFPASTELANIALTDSLLTADGAIGRPSGGEIRLNGEQLILNNSTIRSSSFGIEDGGNIDVRAGELLLENSTIKTETTTAATGGAVTVSAGSIALNNGSIINTLSRSGQGNSGRVTVSATGDINLTNRAQIGSVLIGNPNLDGVGSVGSITVTANNFRAEQNSGILSSNFLGRGQSGSVSVTGQDTISLDGNSILATSSLGESASGDITIKSEHFALSNSAKVFTTAFDPTLLLDPNLDLSNLDPASAAVFQAGLPLFVELIQEIAPGTLGQGDAGNIVVDVEGNLTASSGAQMVSSTVGRGNAGNINIEVGDRVSLEGDPLRSTGIFSTVEAGSLGRGGNIKLLAGSLEVSEGASFTASTRGQGNAGNIAIEVRENARFDGTTENAQQSSGAFSTVEAGAQGRGGNIKISANALEVMNGAVLNASTLGVGNAGDVVIDVQDSVSFENRGGGNQPSSSAGSIVGIGAQGNGGNVEVSAGSIRAINGALLTASTNGMGNAGNITINVEGRALFDGTTESAQQSSGAFSTVELGAEGEGGSVRIFANALEVTNGAVLNASTLGTGNAGDVVIGVTGDVVFDGTAANGQPSSGAGSLVGIEAQGNGGNVEISANTLQVTNGAALSASTLGFGDAGNVVIAVKDRAIFSGTTPNGQFGSGAFSTVESGALGNGGNVEISANSLEIRNGAALNATVGGMGNAGNIVIEVQDRTVLAGANDNSQFTGAASAVNIGARGNGGNVELSTSSLEVTNGAVLTASTGGEGDAGNVSVVVRDRALFDGSSANGQFGSGVSSTVESGARGNGGNVILSANSLEVTNGALLSASTRGTGNAGDVVIAVSDHALFDGVMDGGEFSSSASSTVEADAQGNGGNVKISARSLEVTNGAALNASTSGRGDAGDVRLNVRDYLLFSGSTPDNQFASGAFSVVGAEAMGAGGDIEVLTRSLEVTEGGSINASTSGEGNAGNVLIDAGDRIVVEGLSPDGQFSSGVSSEAQAGALGDGGDLRISAQSLSLLNGAVLQASTSGTGDAGSISIETERLVTLAGAGQRGFLNGSPSGIFTTNGRNPTEPGTGRSGDVNINTSRLSIQDGATISARTLNDQLAGDINIEVDSLALLNGGQIIAASNSSGAAGTLRIDATGRVEISGVDANFLERTRNALTIGELTQPQSNLTVQSNANGPAGNIRLNARELVLTDQGSLIAESSTVDGGNIMLNLDQLLLLRNGGNITATAGTAQSSGNGGNVTINAPFIVAIPAENSDITANAFAGTGGRVSITAEGVFGIEPRLQRTALSDITASSEQGVSGIVALNTLDTGFITSNLTDLVKNLVAPDTLVANSCIARSQSNGTLVLNNSEGSSQQPSSSQSAYPAGSVQAIPPLESNHSSVIEPQAIYRLSDGRLVMGRACSGN